MWLRAFLVFIISSLAFADIDYDAGVGGGRITYYAQSQQVACDIPQSEWPPYTAALDEDHFQGGLACGATARLMKNGNEIQVQIVDLCPEAENQEWCSGDVTHFDLGGTNTFSQLEPAVTGVTDIQFEWIPTPVGNEPVKLRLKDGINAWWVAIQVINHRYPVANLEIQDPSGNWITGNRNQPGMWNYWQFDFAGNGLQPPFNIRITDQYGQVIQETGTVVQENHMWSGQNQFPLLERHGGTTSLPGSSGETVPHLKASISGNILHFGNLKPESITIFDIAGRRVTIVDVYDAKSFVELPKLRTGIYHVKLSAAGASSTLRWFSGR